MHSYILRAFFWRGFSESVAKPPIRIVSLESLKPNNGRKNSQYWSVRTDFYVTVYWTAPAPSLFGVFRIIGKTKLFGTIKVHRVTVNERLHSRTVYRSHMDSDIFELDAIGIIFFFFSDLKKKRNGTRSVFWQAGIWTTKVPSTVCTPHPQSTHWNES